MSMRSLPAAVAVVVSALFVLGCNLTESARFTRTDTITHAHAATSPVQAEVSNGSIEIARGANAEVVITADIKATTQERLDNTRVVVTRTDDQTLDIRVDWAEGVRKGSEGCSLVITMPDASTVNLKTSNGRLTVQGVGSDLTLRTSNGRITAGDIPGRVDAHTSNGRVVLSEIGGAIDIDTSNGAVELAGVMGPVRANTSNGSVSIRLASDGVGPIRVSTSNGAATLAVGDAFAGELRLKTSNGKVRVNGPVSTESMDLDKRSGTLVFAGSGSSTITTSNGSITVEAAKD
jgi:DUF4097 and DUF4098 domain-containing protein YvlB